jgi:hypothetical protein
VIRELVVVLTLFRISPIHTSNPGQRSDVNKFTQHRFGCRKADVAEIFVGASGGQPVDTTCFFGTVLLCVPKTQTRMQW